MAVLPFKPLLPENRDQVLEMGMADTLITKLGNSGRMIVPSLASVRNTGVWIKIRWQRDENWA